jgi:prepilin-type N-terminal cleavage/methylation domain-containing protein
MNLKSCELKSEGRSPKSVPLPLTGLPTYPLTVPSPALRAPLHAPRITHHASRITHHASRITHHASRAFTLIELLVVIAIIAILAALIFPVVGAVNRAKIRARAQAEMSQIVMGIENYKAKLGHYPPDNAPRWDVNQLYYELMGTSLSNNGSYTTLDGVTLITAGDLTASFPAVGGFINATKGSSGDEASGAAKYLAGLRANQYLAVTTPAPLKYTALGAALDTTNILADASQHKINPWNYNSSSPTNNPRSYDLWIDIPINGRINRICNWSPKPIIF